MTSHIRFKKKTHWIFLLNALIASIGTHKFLYPLLQIMPPYEAFAKLLAGCITCYTRAFQDAPDLVGLKLRHPLKLRGLPPNVRKTPETGEVRRSSEIKK